MSKEKRRVPKLRFPGFTEDWEQCKLKSIANTIVAGGDIDKNKIKESGTYLVIANALTKDGVVGYYEDTYRIEAPAVTVTGRGDIGVAKARHQNFTPVVRLLSLTTAHDVDFIENAINNLKIVSESTGVAQLTVPQLSNYKIHITSILEERKIGLFISKVDNLITLHQRKLNNLKLKKKALFQKLFPKNGERYPELRFPGFTDAWEQRKLSEVTTCFDNLRVAVTASDRVPGKIPYYGANGIQDYVSGHTHSGEFVLIAEDGANDLNDYPIQYVNGAIWVNNHAHVIAGYKEKLENNFLSYSLKTVKMTTFIVGGGRSKLNLKALLEIPISMPNYDEQCVIGEFIETIDKNITLHQRKLDHLQLQKKALLQQMFV